jgi:hypothetical protein
MTTRIVCAALVLAFIVVTPAAAQRSAALDSTVIAQRWNAVFQAVLAERGLQLQDATGKPVAPGVRADRISGDAEAVRAAYEDALARLVLDPAIQKVVFTPDGTLVDQQATASDRAWVARLAASDAGVKEAKTVNASSTNPAAPRVAERSGFSDLIALALDSQKIISSNDTAVSVNLNALALIGLSSDRESGPALYRRHDTLRRLGGTFTFGEKVPEGEITGLTGLPSAADLFDTISWDVRVRVYGDRDPRARRWDDVMQGSLGGLNQVSSDVLGLVPIGDAVIVKTILNDRLGLAVANVKKQLNRSAQITIKGAGQHLTEVSGKDKYSIAVLADKGFSDNSDITLNTLVSVVDDVTLVPSTTVSLKTWTLTLALNHLTAKNALVQGRAIELSANVNVEVPFDDDPALPEPRENKWHVVGSVILPLADAAKIPVSITWTSDPARLVKEKYVTGHIGVSYDFGALKKLFKPVTP